MTAPNELELEGYLRHTPLADLIVELRQTRLDGSLRLEHEAQKIIVYFKSGEIVYAVSNARTARLFDLLLRAGKIEKTLLAENPNYANDLEFARTLREKNLFSEKEIERLFSAQIETVLRDALQWQNGKWTFSPLVKIRDGIKFPVETAQMLAQYARQLTGEEIARRFRSVKEIFAASGDSLGSTKVALQSHEAFVLSRFADAELSAEQAIQLGGLPEAATLQTLYVLWLGGFLIRRNWNSVFTEHRVNTILSARLARKKEAIDLPSAQKPLATEPLSATPNETVAQNSAAANGAEKRAPDEAAKEISLEAYLARLESADNFYDVLAVEAKAPLADIKQSYFRLAKQFHPDRFYKRTGEAEHKRIQNAFAKIAQAYETLKNQETRTTYDFKMRKELAQRERTAGGAEEINQRKQTDWATENFETGFSHLMDEDYAEALPFLARAVHLAPNVARFHAYYGKALADDETQRFKAEAEMQTAIKLDGDNPTFRLLLAEFFVQYNLLKRAEGELNRLLAVFPSNRDAREMLDSLQNK
jgi:curved DNA-binding protein CbpA